MTGRSLVSTLVLAGAVLVAGSAAARDVSPQQGADRMAPGPPHTTKLEIGSPPPVDLTLESLDGAERSTAAAGRPLLLVFFRGVW